MRDQLIMRDSPSGVCPRSAVSQVVLLGLVCFCVPGVFNAVTSLAGGIQDKSVASEAVALLYAAFAVCSIAAPIACNMLGPRPTLFVGSLGYILYLVALCTHPHLDPAVGRITVVGAGLCNGVGAALLWTAQGALIMSYPTPSTKGRLLAAFWVIFNLGAVCGGLLTFGLNFEPDERRSDDDQAASPATLLAFAAVMVLGAAGALLLQPLDRVVRSDGSIVGAAAARGRRVRGGCAAALRAEARGVLRLFARPRMLALAPLFLYSNWFYAYQFACFNATLFSARTQGLNNAFYWAAQMAGALLFGRFLDDTAVPLRRRALASLGLMSGLLVVSWGLGVWAQVFYHLDARQCHAQRDLNASAPAWCDANATAPAYNWSGWCSYSYLSYDAWYDGNCSQGDSYDYDDNGTSYSYSYGASDEGERAYETLDAADFVVALAPGALYVLWGFCDALVQCWAYWLLGQLDSAPEALSRSAGYYKALQAAGGAASWALSVQSSGVPPSAQIVVNVLLCALALPLAAVAVARAPELADEAEAAEREEQEEPAQ